MPKDPLDEFNLWLGSTITASRTRVGERFSFYIKGLSNATLQWDPNFIQNELPSLCELSYEYGVDFIVVWTESGTHASAGELLSDAILDEVKGMGLWSMVRPAGTASITVHPPSQYMTRKPDGSFAPDHAGADPRVSVLIETAYSQTLASAQEKVRVCYLSTGHVCRCFIMEIKPERNTIRPPPPAVDPMVSIRIEQWVLQNGVALLDQSLVGSPLEWQEGGAPVLRNLQLPLVNLFRNNFPPPNLLPLALQNNPLLANMSIIVPANRLQTIFERIARYHHQRL